MPSDYDDNYINLSAANNFNPYRLNNGSGVYYSTGDDDSADIDYEHPYSDNDGIAAYLPSRNHDGAMSEPDHRNERSEHLLAQYDSGHTGILSDF